MAYQKTLTKVQNQKSNWQTTKGKAQYAGTVCKSFASGGRTVTVRQGVQRS